MHIVLDVDGTLISEGKTKEEVKARPHLGEFLDFCFAAFESVSIWTAASREYFDEVHSPFLREYKFQHIFTGEKCTRTYQSSLYWSVQPQCLVKKSLRKFWKLKDQGYNQDNTIIIDDTPETYRNNYGNGIPIDSYYGNTDDMVLKDLKDFLKQLKMIYQNTGSIRQVEKRFWRQHSHL